MRGSGEHNLVFYHSSRRIPVIKPIWASGMMCNNSQCGFFVHVQRNFSQYVFPGFLQTVLGDTGDTSGHIQWGLQENQDLALGCATIL